MRHETSTPRATPARPANSAAPTTSQPSVGMSIGKHPQGEMTMQISEPRLDVVERALNHGTLIQRSVELAIIHEWLSSHWEAPDEVRIALRRTIWAYQNDARNALQTLGGLAAAW